MALGNLSIKVSADVGGFTSSMDIAAKAAHSGMGASADSIDEFRKSLLQASADMQKAALAMSGNMQAANDAITSSSEKSAEAIQNISDTAGKADFKSMGEKIAEAIGAGIGAGLFAAQKGWEGFVAYAKVKALVVGIAIGAIFAAVGLGVVYTAYKVISGSIGFIAGLITGSSYKSASIDALIEANNHVKEIQNSLLLTAQQATATDAAIKAIGVSKTDYTAVFTGAATAVRANTEELDRLGVQYKDTSGKLLPLEQVVQNANKVLGEYTEGWDRNQAAQAIGLGTAAQVAAAATVTGEKIAEAAARLNDYNLGIGDESQAAVKRYEDAMRDFNRESELTSQGFKRAWSDQIMPILTDLAEFFKDGFPSAVNVFRYSMAVITSLFYGLKTVVYLVTESILGSIQALGMGIGGLAVAAGRALTGDFSGAKEALVQGWADAKNRLGGIGDNIVAQARHNSDAMRQAWALDDRNETGIAVVRKGKTWVPKPDAAKAAASKGAVDDPAKKIMEGQIKEQEALMAAEKTLLQTREQYLDYYHGLEYFTLRDIEEKKQELMAENLKAMQQHYGEEIAAAKTYIAHAQEIANERDEQDGRNVLAEILKKRTASEIEANKQIEDSQKKLEAVKRHFNLATEETTRQQEKVNAESQFQIDLLGKNTLEAQKLTAARRIQLDLDERIFQLKKLDPTVDTSKAIADAAIQQAKVTALIEQGYNKERDAIFGANEALRKYAEDAGNKGAQIEHTLTNAFQNMEDALVSFVTTGKISFKSLADSIVADITRMIIKEQLSKIIGGGSAGGGVGGVGGLFTSFAGLLFGGGGSFDMYGGSTGATNSALMSLYGNGLAGARAAGGSVLGGSSYLVGEKGPEIFTPSGNGNIIPNSAMNGDGSGSQPIVVTNNFTINGPTDRSTQQQIAARAAQGAQRALARNT